MKYRNFLLLASIFLLLVNTAYANAGLPMIVIAWPLFKIALIPIILI